MVIKAFEYYAPESIKEAIDLLREPGDRATILGGGESLIPIMKLGLSDFDHLIDLKRIKDMNYIKDTGNASIAIGALTKH
ncbi:MAG: FAD binding domain-containing protein, partial [Thaumarchaeota archaeon]|nr:FAD binding domain-containing protein [Nitrososphaerota archaeon]